MTANAQHKPSQSVCKDFAIREKLWDFYYGVLSPEEASNFEIHLGLCEACQQSILYLDWFSRALDERTFKTDSKLKERHQPDGAREQALKARYVLPPLLLADGYMAKAEKKLALAAAAKGQAANDLKEEAIRYFLQADALEPGIAMAALLGLGFAPGA